MHRSGCRQKNCGSGSRCEGAAQTQTTRCLEVAIHTGRGRNSSPLPLAGKEQSAPADESSNIVRGSTTVLRMTPFAALIRREIRIAMRVGGGALIGVLFFLTVVVLMPFAVGPDLALLKRLGPAILWLGALLASLLTLDRLFIADHDDGSLDLIIMGRTPLELTCAAKALAHWLAAGLPLIIATPVL